MTLKVIHGIIGTHFRLVLVIAHLHERSRGFDSGNSDNPFCSTAPAQYVREANEETFIIVQLESPSAVDRAAELCSELLAYSGKGSFTIEPFDAEQLVEEMRSLMDICSPYGTLLNDGLRPILHSL